MQSPGHPSFPPSRRTAPSLRSRLAGWEPPTWLTRLGFVVGILAMWMGLLAWLAPELGARLWGPPRPPSQAETRALLLTVMPRLETLLGEALVEHAPGIRLLRHSSTVQRLGGLRWNASLLTLQLPAGLEPELLADRLEALQVPGAWEVSVGRLELEPLSVSLQWSIGGYPIQILTLLNPTLADPLPEEIAPRPRIALLIDDLGQQLRGVMPLLSVPQPFSVAILPYSPHGLALAEEAYARRKEILVHLPMQALAREDGTILEPELGELRLEMDEEELHRVTRRALRAVPFAVGVNNHRGSAFTRVREPLRHALEMVRREGMFFVDSRTVPDSRAEEVARSLGIPTTRRQVFLDAAPSPASIDLAFERLKTLARRDGKALGIGHPSAVMLAQLQRWLPRLEQEGFLLVPVSSLVELPRADQEEHKAAVPARADLPQSL